MRVVTEYVIALAELAEAEGRAARRGVLKLLAAAGVALVAAGLVAAAAGFGCWGLYLKLQPCMGDADAAMGVAVAAAVFAVGLLWCARQIVL